jgi:hypothetical protein
VAVTVGGELMGIAGMLVMIPLVSVVYTLMREITNNRLGRRGIDRSKLQDQPPELHSKLQQTRASVEKKKSDQVETVLEDGATTEEG